MSVTVPGTRFTVKTKTVDGAEVQFTALQPATAATPVTPVVGSIAAVTILPTSTTRINAMITNDSDATLYLTIGATPRDPSPTDWDVKLYPDDMFEHGIAPGLAIKGVWSTASGQARILEFT